MTQPRRALRVAFVSLTALAACAGRRDRDEGVPSEASLGADGERDGEAPPTDTAALDAHDASLAPDALDVVDALDASPGLDAPDAAPAHDAPREAAASCAVPGLTRCGDRCVDLASDNANCGVCGASCMTGPRATGACNAGECERTCDMGYGDCDGDLRNGCESELSTVTNCGVCGRRCEGAQVCAAGACTAPERVAAPRLFAPLSGTRVTHRRPELVWVPVEGVGGVQVQVCRRRACAEGDVVTAFVSSASRASVPIDLAPGVYFWRARSGAAGAFGSAWSPVWQFRVGAREAGTSIAWGAEPDFNGDGYADIAVGAVARAMGNGGAYVFYGAETGPRETPDWVMLGRDGADTRFGVGLGSVGDVNGDGFVDLAVGASEVGARAGRVTVYFGSALGLATTGSVLAGPMADNRMGETVTALGDVNGDGYADLATGAPLYGRDGDGAVYVYFGSAMGPAARAPQLVRMTPTEVKIRLGRSLSTLGDVNGDGFGDLLVGAPGEDMSGSYVFVFNGGAGGLAAMPSLRLLGRGTLEMPTRGEYFSASIAGVGDVNGDGFFDALVGATGTNNLAGYARLYLGSARGLSAMPAWERVGAATDGVGASVSGGADVNGDGFDDVVLVDIGPARVRVWLGGAAGLAGEGTLLDVQYADGTGAQRAALVGDVNGDGFADVATGSPGANGGRGGVRLFYGGREGISARPGWSAQGPDEGAQMGTAIGRW